MEVVKRMPKITLKAARVNAGLTQKEAAEKLGVSPKTLCNWENGNCVPLVDKIDPICELYDIHYDNLIFYSK
jgi:transcriptional regulator with XRE-family HTH domain